MQITQLLTKWFRVKKGVSPIFEGIYLLAALDGGQVPHLANIKKIVDTNMIFGDREVTINLPDSLLYINSNYLEVVEDPQLREFDYKNPWGKFQCEGRNTAGNIEVAWAEFANCLQVNIFEKNTQTKTLFSYNFLNPADFSKVHLAIATSIRDDLENLIFTLKEIAFHGEKI